MTTIDLSIAIQHTPGRADREAWVGSMLRKIRTEQPTVDLTVIADEKREGSWPTFLRTLHANSGSTHHLVLNDDLSLCQDFVATVKEVIRARPYDLISLYTNSRAVFSAWHRREAWIQKSGVEGAAVIWPRELIAEFTEWQSRHVASDFPWEDVRVSMWLKKTSRPSFATVPSLAQHLGCGASLLGLNGRSKVAAWYVGDDRSPLGVDWTQGRRRPIKDSMRFEPEWWDGFRE